MAAAVHGVLFNPAKLRDADNLQAAHLSTAPNRVPRDASHLKHS